MPSTLGAAFDASIDALRAATRAVPAIPEPGQVRTLLFQTQEFFAGLRTSPDTFARDAARAPGPGSFMNRALADIRAHFAVADRHLADALRRVLIISGPSGEPADHLQAAATRLAVPRDLIGTHRGPDGEPLTPYRYLLADYLLADARAQRHVFFRVTDLAGELGHFMERGRHVGARRRGGRPGDPRRPPGPPRHRPVAERRGPRTNLEERAAAGLPFRGRPGEDDE
ncbi:hypothetical protein [Streptomyces sp. PT12]|uniref:hypothetical protein n=1 Tax=Streptomyces sp. PT12 TaxID=1510197 RepID=UPI000DE480B3|nr:hypothetical protein [Streptomyces sp. PT12]RBM06843.1 hypothetical protein DEH69_25595 [Streptomyces sp. PT12]